MNQLEDHTAIDRLPPPVVLSTLWIAELLMTLFRDMHEILRPGFVDELAHSGTVYGVRVSDGALVGSGVVLVFMVSVVVLARILPRRSNRRVNFVAAAFMALGVLASWPKDSDDLLFGAVQLLGVGLIVMLCARWRDPHSPPKPDTSARPRSLPARPVSSAH